MPRIVRHGIVLLFVALVAGQAFAGGAVTVRNESDQGIHPWFKSNCWVDWIGAPKDTWVYFGGIGPRGQFPWDFKELVACDGAEVQFTYTLDGDPNPPQDPVKGTLRTVFLWAPDTNFALQIGEKVRALELQAPDGKGR